MRGYTEGRRFKEEGWFGDRERSSGCNAGREGFLFAFPFYGIDSIWLLLLV